MIVLYYARRLPICFSSVDNLERWVNGEEKEEEIAEEKREAGLEEYLAIKECRGRTSLQEAPRVSIVDFTRNPQENVSSKREFILF